MPILSTQILGTNIEIEFKENEKEKLEKLIESYKKRLNKLSNNGRTNSTTLMFFASLKIEDELVETKNNLKKSKEEIENIKGIIENQQNEILQLSAKNKKENITIEEKRIEINYLNKEIILLKSKFNDIQKDEASELEKNQQAIKEIDDLKNAIELIKQKIKDSLL